MDSWEFFKRFLFSSRAGSVVRSLSRVSMGAIFLGAASLVLVLSVMNGLGGSIEDRLLRVEPHIVVTLKQGGDWLEGREKIAEAVMPIFHGSSFFYPTQIQDVVVRTLDGGIGGAELKSLPQQEIDRIMEFSKVYWSDPSRELSEGLEVQEVLMGSELAHQLGLFEGDEISVLPPETLLLPPGEIPPVERLRIVGLFSTDHSDFDSKTILYSHERGLVRLRSTASLRRMYEFRLDPGNDVEDVSALLRSSDLEVSTWRQRNATLFFALKMERYLVGLLVALSGLIASFSVITVLTLLMTQKRKDMAILMVLGLSPARVKKLFFGVGLALSWLGVVSGVVLGVVLALLLDQYSDGILPDIYHDQSLPAKVRVSQVLGVLGMAMIYCIVIVWWVVHRQVSQSPSQALR